MKINLEDDLLNLKNNPILVNNENIILSCPIILLSDSSKRFDRSFGLSDKAIYIIEEKRIKRRISISQIEAITTSTYSMEFVIHIKDNFDLRLSSPQKRMEIIEKIIYLYCSKEKLGLSFKLYEVNHLNLVGIMTTESNYKFKKRVRPPESCLKEIDFVKFIKKKGAELERLTELRKNTILLAHNINEKVSDISIEDFELIKLLGRGTFGSVYLGKKKTGDKLYAIKRINKSEIIENNQLEHTKVEKQILSNVNHNFLVSLDYAFQSGANLYFVVEFMKGGELSRYLKNVGRFTEDHSLFYTVCVVLGLSYLHNKDFIYRDLKLENLMLDEKGYLKITDFGLAKFLPKNDSTQTFCGTPEFIAPEIIELRGHNRMVDWWSLGILIYYFLFGKPPFSSMNTNLLFKQILKEHVKFPETPKISQNAKDIIIRLLEKDPTKRLGFIHDSMEILSHPWIANYEIDKLLARSIPAPFIPETEGDKWESNFDEETMTEQFRPTDINDIRMNLADYKKDFDSMNVG